MPIFEKPSRDSLSHCDERWTPIYLERGRLEVDDSSVKWIGADRTVFRVPIATVSALVLGPETTLEAAFQALSLDPSADETQVLTLLKQKIEAAKLPRRIPKDIYRWLGLKTDEKKNDVL